MKYVDYIRKIRWVIAIGVFVLLSCGSYLLYQDVHTRQLDKRFEDGDNSFNLEDYEGAISEYRKVFEESTEQNVKAIALRAIGQTYYDKLKNYEQALSAFQELIETFPDSRFQEEAMFKVAYCLGQLGRDDEALKQYEALVTQFPESKSQYFTLSYFNQGATYSRQENYEKARENYEKSSQSTTNRKRKAEIQLRIGNTYRFQDKYDNAITIYTSLLDEYPNGDFIAKAKYNIALSHFHMERWDIAITWYDRVIKEHQDAADILPNCYYRIGNAYNNAYNKFSVKHTEANETDQAIEKLKQGLDWYQKTIDSFPDSYRTRYNISYDLHQIWKTNYEKQNNKAAQLALQMLMRNFPFSFDLQAVEIDLILIASRSNLQQNYQGALRAFQELITYFPTGTYVEIARYSIGEANYQLQNYTEARKTLAEFLKVFPNSNLKGVARRLIAHSYRLEREYNQAYLAFDMLTSTEFDRSPQLQEEAMYYAAHSLKQLKVYDEALGRYAEFLTRFPNSKHVTEAYFDRGEIYAYGFNKKDYVLARSNYERAWRNTDPNNKTKLAKFQLQIGHTYYNQRNFEQALTAYNLLLREYPQSKETVEARRQIAHIHRRDDKWDKAIAEYKLIIKNQGEYKTVDRIPITLTGGDELRRFTDIIAMSHFEIGAASYEKENFEEAFKQLVRIVKKPKDAEKDLRTDPIAPYAMYRAMQSLNNLWDRGELGSQVKSELRDILELSPQEPLENKIEEVLARFANKYISYLDELSEHSLNDNDKLILSAEARLNFAKILHEKLKRYDKAAAEYTKLQEDYSPIPHPRLDLIKLKGKYYKGLCYSELSRLKDADKAYKEAITLFNTIFQPLIGIPNIDAPNIEKKALDYCIQTALEYAERACDKIKDTEYAKKARDKIKEARRKLEDKNKATEKSGASNNSDALGQSNAEGQLTPEQIAQKTSSSTVFIKTEGTWEYKNGRIINGETGFGSGFFVSSDQIATNYHVIAPTYYKDDSTTEIVFKHPLRGTARIVGTDREYTIIGYAAIDPDRDLAILKIRAYGVEPLVLGDSDRDSIKQGTPAYPIGNPHGFVNVVSDGKISSVQWVKSTREFLSGRSKLVRDVQADDTPQQLLMMTAPISPGSSGGPVLDSKGRVIGVSVGTVPAAQNLNFAVPVNYLKALLNLVGSPKPLSNLEIIF